MTLVTATTADLLSTAQPQEGEASNDDQDTIRHLKFIVWGVMGCTLAIIGFLGNILSMVVLQQRQMRSSTSYYLLSLAIYDNGVLLGMLFFFILPALMTNTDSMDAYMTLYIKTLPVGYPLSLTAQMGSIYTCVGFTIERFIAVCKPLHVANTCTKSRALRAILLIFIWSVAYNIPRFFHYHITYAPLVPPGVSDANAAPSANSSHLAINSPFEQRVKPRWCAHLAPGVMGYTGYNNLTSSCVVNGTPSLQGWGMDKLLVNFQTRPTSEMDSPAKEGSTDSSAGSRGQSGTTPIPPRQSEGSTFFTQSPAQSPAVRETEFGSDPIFQHIYLIYSYLFFMFLLPFVVILVMNMYLISAVKKSRSTRQSLSTSASKEQNLTVMLIAVIVVFLVCQFPTIIDNILLAVMGQDKLNLNYSYQVRTDKTIYDVYHQ